MPSTPGRAHCVIALYYGTNPRKAILFGTGLAGLRSEPSRADIDPIRTDIVHTIFDAINNFAQALGYPGPHVHKGPWVPKSSWVPKNPWVPNGPWVPQGNVIAPPGRGHPIKGTLTYL